MTGLLEMREKLKLLYSKNDVFIIPVVKFLVAFITISMINGRMGYMTRVDNLAVVMIGSLLCSFMPMGCIILLGALFSLLHMYALSVEVALVGLCLYLIIALLYFRFSPKDALVVVLTPIAFVLKIPYVMPITMGLLGTPASAISISCGVIIYYFLKHVVVNATAISSLDEGEAAAKLKLLIDGILDNKVMVVMIVAFAITIFVVYMIRRLSIDYAWTIAMAAGAISDLMVLLVGDLVYDTNVSVGGAILGTLVAIAIAKVIEFFRFCVDYSRTEKVQFEDDEYYYYVKAVPKMNVAARSTTVKKINTQRRNVSNTARMSSSAGRTTSAGNGRSVYEGSSGARSVMTERTYVNHNSTEREEFRRRTNARQRISADTDMMAELELEDMDGDFQWEQE